MLKLPVFTDRFDDCPLIIGEISPMVFARGPSVNAMMDSETGAPQGAAWFCAIASFHPPTLWIHLTLHPLLLFKDEDSLKFRMKARQTHFSSFE